MIVVSGDHGFFYGEHGLGEERRLAYEETIRIPLLMRYPALIPAGTAPESLVLSIDMAPTLLELAGLGVGSGLQGRSLLPLFRETSPPWRRSFLIEYWSDTVFPRIRNMGYQAVRTERHKYIHYRELPGMDELYDLQVDPGESEESRRVRRAAALLAQMESELQRLLAESRGQDSN